MHIQRSTVINCDGDRAFFRLEKLTQLENSVVDYTDENHKLRWLNTFAGNIQSNINHVFFNTYGRTEEFML